MTLAVAAETLAGAVALVGARASILVLLVEVATGALAPAAAVPAQTDIIYIFASLHISFAARLLLCVLKLEVGLLVIVMSRTRIESLHC